MNNVIDIKSKKIEMIEKKAFEEYGVIKLNEDSYMVPSNVAYSEEEIIKESSLIELVVLEEAIKKLEEKYEKAEIILDADDFEDYSIKEVK